MPKLPKTHRFLVNFTDWPHFDMESAARMRQTAKRITRATFLKYVDAWSVPCASQLGWQWQHHIVPVLGCLFFKATLHGHTVYIFGDEGEMATSGKVFAPEGFSWPPHEDYEYTVEGSYVESIC